MIYVRDLVLHATPGMKENVNRNRLAVATNKT
jgi:hypothetical protein